MGENVFARAFTGLEKRRGLFLLLLAAVTVVAAALVAFLPFDNSLEIMLPGNDEIRRTLRFLEEAKFSEKVALSFSRDDARLTTGEFLGIVDEVAGRLGPPLVSRMLSDVSDPEMVEGMESFVRHTPEILGERELRRIDGLLNPEGVKKCLHRRYMQLLKPGGSWLAPMIRRDPLNVGGTVLRRLRRIASSFGYDVQIEGGHLVSNDGDHFLVLLETPVRMMDGEGARRLLEYIEGVLSELPASVGVDVVCGHAHTVSNERTIRADIKLTVVIAGVGFLLLFLGYFRDPAALLIFVIPVASVVISLDLSTLLYGRLSVLVVGLGAVIAGIAVDYGIHVYVAIRTGAGEGSRIVGVVGRPIMLGALTTLSVFVAFFFSSIEGYRQLGCFSIISILISLALALFVLPQCLRGRPGKDRGHGSARVIQGTAWRVRDIVSSAVFVVLMGAGVYAALGMEFTSDVSQLDGSGRRVREAETRFRDVWGVGESDLAMLVVSGSDFERSAEARDRLNDEVRAAIGEENLLDLSSVWPSKRRRTRNVERWMGFWREGRAASLRGMLLDQGKPYQFAEDAFEPFFEDLRDAGRIAEEPVESELFRNLGERFVQRSDKGWEFISYFPDRAGPVGIVRSILRGYPDAFVVSRKNLAMALSEAFSREVSLVAAVATVLILVLTLAFLRSWRMSLIALTPTLGGGVWLVGIVSALGRPLNIANLIAGVVVLGLCIDYGIFMTFAHCHALKTGTRTAVTLSAVSTLIGAGVLLFARHPALYSIGLSLVTGVAGGFAVAMLVVPSFCRLLLREERKQA